MSATGASTGLVFPRVMDICLAKRLAISSPSSGWDDLGGGRRGRRRKGGRKREGDREGEAEEELRRLYPEVEEFWEGLRERREQEGGEEDEEDEEGNLKGFV
eukprot:evm.model.NODE_29353_length_14271_cov_25.066639.1